MDHLTTKALEQRNGHPGNENADLVDRLRANAAGDWAGDLHHIPLSMLQAAEVIEYYREDFARDEQVNNDLRARLAAAEADLRDANHLIALWAPRIRAAEAALEAALDGEASGLRGDRTAVDEQSEAR